MFITMQYYHISNNMASIVYNQIQVLIMLCHFVISCNALSVNCFTSNDKPNHLVCVRLYYTLLTLNPGVHPDRQHSIPTPEIKITF